MDPENPLGASLNDPYAEQGCEAHSGQFAQSVTSKLYRSSARWPLPAFEWTDTGSDGFPNQWKNLLTTGLTRLNDQVAVVRPTFCGRVDDGAC